MFNIDYNQSFPLCSIGIKKNILPCSSTYIHKIINKFNPLNVATQAKHVESGDTLNLKYIR